MEKKMNFLTKENTTKFKIAIGIGMLATGIYMNNAQAETSLESQSPTNVEQGSENLDKLKGFFNKTFNAGKNIASQTVEKTKETAETVSNTAKNNEHTQPIIEKSQEAFNGVKNAPATQELQKNVQLLGQNAGLAANNIKNGALSMLEKLRAASQNNETNNGPKP